MTGASLSAPRSPVEQVGHNRGRPPGRWVCKKGSVFHTGLLAERLQCLTKGSEPGTKRGEVRWLAREVSGDNRDGTPAHCSPSVEWRILSQDVGRHRCNPVPPRWAR